VAPAPEPFQYAVLRVVPDLDRGEALNVGVVVFSRRHRFLAARTHLDEARVRAAFPSVDAAALRRHLAGLEHVAAGDPRAGALADLDQSDRFGWLAAASSTIVQASPVHTGLCDDPQRLLDRLFARLVAPPVSD
jgi:hypothetical protein